MFQGVSTNNKALSTFSPAIMKTGPKYRNFRMRW
jgi:hypothetical protein